MKKEQQKVINYVAKNIFDMAMTEYEKRPWYNGKNWERLRYCKAEVIETENFYILRSNSTIVAVIEKASDICVDMRRHEYGFTSTSAQHIAKFRRAYGGDKWGCKIEYTYR